MQEYTNTPWTGKSTIIFTDLDLQNIYPSPYACQDYHNRVLGRFRHLQHNNSPCLKNLIMIVWYTRSSYAKTIRIGYGADPGIYNTMSVATSSDNIMIVWYDHTARSPYAMQKTHCGTRRSFGSWTVYLLFFSLKTCTVFFLHV